MTPIVKSVEGLGIKAISSRARELAKRARAGKLKPEEFQGGTFTISNVGMNPAIKRFSSINPPQAAILAVSTIQNVAVPIEAEKGTQVGLVTVSFGHKVTDGAVGAKWIKEFKDVAESSQKLLL